MSDLQLLLSSSLEKCVTSWRMPRAIARAIMSAIAGTIIRVIAGVIPLLPRRRWRQGLVALGLSGAIALGWAVPGAAAEFCRTLGTNQICIVEIHRSAKRYWEYRAKVRINGQVRAIARYNCRTRVWIDRWGNAHDFAPDGAGQLICDTLPGQ